MADRQRMYTGGRERGTGCLNNVQNLISAHLLLPYPLGVHRIINRYLYVCFVPFWPTFCHLNLPCDLNPTEPTYGNSTMAAYALRLDIPGTYGFLYQYG